MEWRMLGRSTTLCMFRVVVRDGLDWTDWTWTWTLWWLQCMRRRKGDSLTAILNRTSTLSYHPLFLSSSRSSFKLYRNTSLEDQSGRLIKASRFVACFASPIIPALYSPVSGSSKGKRHLRALSFFVDITGNKSDELAN